MKRSAILLLTALLPVFMAQAQQVKEIKTDIKHVTVFPDRAQLEQETTAAIALGKTTYRLTGLSPYIDPQSVQVKGFGDFTILSVNQQNNYLQNLDDSPEIKSLRTQIETLLAKAEDENTAISVLKEKEAFLIANRPILVKEATVSTEQLKNIMELYTSNMEQVKTTTLKKERSIKEINKQIAALQQQLTDKLGKGQLPSGEILVTVSSEKQVQGKLTFSYVVSNAGWYPSYDIRVDDLKNPVAILFKANVFQNTGTDWKDVKLSFSNATPWISGDIPELGTWFIDYYTPIMPALRGVAYGGQPRREKAEISESVAADRIVEMKEMEAAPIPVQKQVGETTVVFDVNIPYSVPADGKTQTVEIQKLTAPADYKYIATPKLSSMAYLSANIPDWAKLSLQSGEATLYFENSFVGKSTINVNQLKDTLTISLGTDNSIVVKREKRKDFTTKKVLGANRTDIFSYQISVRNNKPVPVKLTLNDQLPVSSNSGINVDAVELSGGRYNSVTGEVKWDLDIKPSETKQVILTWSVKYPKDRTIILE